MFIIEIAELFHMRTYQTSPRIGYKASYNHFSLYIYKVLFNIRIMRYIIFVREEIDKENVDVMYIHRIFRVQDILFKYYKMHRFLCY